MLVNCYIAIAKVALSRENSHNQRSKNLVRDILILAGHPLFDDTNVLLDALKPLSSINFDDDLGAAVHWAKITYGINPEQLRPPLLL